MRRRWMAALAVALATAAPPLAAQGFWAGLGLGTGMQQVACDICRGNGNGGWTARAALGGTVSRQLQLGAELHGWTDKTDGIRYTYYSVMPAAYWYPAERLPYFLLGGAGLVRFRAADENESMSSSSLGLTVGMGYELRVAPSYGITAFATYTGSFRASLAYQGTGIADARVSLFQLGLGFTRR